MLAPSALGMLAVAVTAGAAMPAFASGAAGLAL
jgi:hypothetical protein